MPTMAKKGCSCDLCHGSNLASICVHCVNNSLGDFRTSLRSLKNFRNSLYFKLCDGMVAKRRADDQIKWRMNKNERIKELKDRLNFLNSRIREEKRKVDDVSKDLNSRNQLLNSAFATLKNNQTDILEKINTNIIYSHELALMAITSERLHKQAVVIKQISRLYPLRRVIADEGKEASHAPYDQICNARLPKGLDPHSVPSDELAASLGYIVQLLNLLVPNLAAPALHNSGFAGSCSRIWQRDSYWDARPSSRSKEYPLFIPRQNFCSSGGENSWSERSSLNFEDSSLESDRKPHLDATRSGSFNYSSASQHSMESHKELQKGISLLKKSVACITSYCSNSLCLEIPSEASTFEAFAKLLAILSSYKDLQSTRKSLKVSSSRSDKQAQQLNKSVWKVNSAVSSNSLEDSMRTTVIPSSRDSTLSNSLPSFLDYGEIIEHGKYEGLAEGWDLVEHPTLPPPSEVEDVEHWTRAMFIDVTRK